MIVYRKGISIRVLLRISGSVMPRAAVNALLSAALTYLISCVIPPEVLLQLFNHPYPFQPMAHVVAFALVFRTNVAYNRYWESCTEVCLMSAKWGDTFAEALSFDELSKPRAADAPPLSGEERAQAHRERRLSQARLVHLASLMHALALQYLRRDDDLGKLVSAEVAEPAAAAAAAAAGEWAGATLHLPTAPGTTSRPAGVERDGSDEDRAQEQTMEEVGAASPSSLPSPSEVLAAARRLGRRGAGLTQEVNVWPPLPVLGGVGSEEVLDLEFSEDRVSTLFALVLRHLNERRLAGGLWADAPVLSRVFQVLSDGNLGFRQARKIEDVPFPWPYAQMVAFLLLTFSVTFPLMVASQMAQLPEQGLAVGLERPAQSLFERGIVEWTPPLLTFLTIMGYSGLYSTASVLEDPFVHPPNDLPSVAMQRAFNAQLLTSWDALRPPPPPPDGAKEGGAPDAAAVAAAVLRGPPPECTAAASAAACVPALEWEATCRLWLAWEARWLARLAADQQEQALALAEPSDLRQTRRDPTRSFVFLGFLLYAVEDALLDAASIALALLPFGSRSRERRRWRPFSWFEEGTNVEH